MHSTRQVLIGSVAALVASCVCVEPYRQAELVYDAGVWSASRKSPANEDASVHAV